MGEVEEGGFELEDEAEAHVGQVFEGEVVGELVLARG